MKLYSVNDPEFHPYGEIVRGYDTEQLLEVLEKETPCPDNVLYVASDPKLESLDIAKQIETNLYGGMPVQLGWCNGYNTKLNCLEYHRDSEMDLGATDLILMLARQEELVDGVLDTKKVKAFHCPRGTLLNLYATTLHFAPCSTGAGERFRMMVALPRGTNGPMPPLQHLNAEDRWLWGCNKWLLAHPESTEAAQGAYQGLVGENIDVSLLWEKE